MKYVKHPHTRYPDEITCPECGFLTHELYHVTSMNDSKNEVLMCDSCVVETEETE